jgi:hypothetical protein
MLAATIAGIPGKGMTPGEFTRHLMPLVAK